MVKPPWTFLFGLTIALVFYFVEVSVAWCESLWDHNGSVMRLLTDGANRVFVYEVPRQSLLDIGVRPGTVLFTGIRDGDKYQGSARRFSQHCSTPIVYSVSGKVISEKMVVLTGVVHIVNEKCQETGKTRQDELVFRFLRSTEVAGGIANGQETPIPNAGISTDGSKTTGPQYPSVTGTGFQISSDSHVLTNFHVAGRCKSLALRKMGQHPIPAELVAGDSTNDLALLRAKTPLAGTIASFASGPPPRAGSDIAVFGFPLTSVLSDSGNIVIGNITSLAGLGNDSRLFQISAPVQPGNSGGPVLDRRGHVVAVIVSKLDSVLVAEKIGDIPQNVNFAIKANVAINFLDGVGVKYMRLEGGEVLDTPSIADAAQGFTFLVECVN